jgi:hypothetical protein
MPLCLSATIVSTAFAPMPSKRRTVFAPNERTVFAPNERRLTLALQPAIVGTALTFMRRHGMASALRTYQTKAQHTTK